MQKMEALKDYTKIVVETDEKNPVTIATITNGETVVADGYRGSIDAKIRLMFFVAWRARVIAITVLRTNLTVPTLNDNFALLVNSYISCVSGSI